MRHTRWLRGGALQALLFSVVLLVGCASTDTNIQRLEETVTALPAGEVAAVDAEALAEAMLRAGFTPEQILKHGPAVRNALATSGGAQVREGKYVAAMFSIHAEELYVTSKARGTFKQPLFPDPPA